MICFKCVMRKRFMPPELCKSCKEESLLERKDKALESLIRWNDKEQLKVLPPSFDLALHHSFTRPQKETQELRDTYRQTERKAKQKEYQRKYRDAHRKFIDKAKRDDRKQGEIK